ncbi:MAG: translational GTPase TypA [Clostridia bacterium]|nr:translational GTPase TypA [Clostridia bacterium]
MNKEKIRNIAIIAHVDHGKTSLVNELLKQGGVFRNNQEVGDRVMDSNALERERGITILAKNAAIYYKDYKINVIDTPGHSDFGGEVERALKMVDGVLLVVDSFEGTMPQTRFVLEKALSLNLKVIVVINKIDRPDARINEVQDEVLELLFDLNASDEQLESPVIYASARQGIASDKADVLGTNMVPLFEEIINHIPAPSGNEAEPLQMIVSNTEQNEFLGKLAVGKIENGNIKVGQMVAITNFFNQEKVTKVRVQQLFVFDGMKKVETQECSAGDIVCIAGLGDIMIGDTICDTENVKALEFVKISEPSVEMTFMVNDSPFAGQEGKFVTSRHLRDRLQKEAIKDLSLRVEDTDTTDAFKVRGRGEMHLSILIENMRREGYEFQVSMPKVLFKYDENKKLMEPIDKLVIDVPEDCVGAVMNKIGVRKGELLDMKVQGSRTRLEFLIPSRGLFGYKSEFLTDTKGEGVLSSVHYGYDYYKGDIERRTCGALVAHENGECIGYGLANAQERGTLFVKPGDKVYAGMIVGENPRGEDLVVNVCKRKQLTNMRAAGSDDALRLIPPKQLSLEKAIEFLNDDELLDVTPLSIRLRKTELNHDKRAQMKYRKKMGID